MLFTKEKTHIIKYPEGREDETYCIPKSVDVIKSNAFYACSNLKNLYIYSGHPENMTVGNNAFSDIPEDAVLYVPIGTGYAYRHHPEFGKFKTVIPKRFE